MAPYGFDIVLVVLVGLVILTIALGVRTVPQDYNDTIERFGRYSRTLGAGLGLIVPYIDRVGHKVNMSKALSTLDERYDQKAQDVRSTKS